MRRLALALLLIGCRGAAAEPQGDEDGAAERAPLAKIDRIVHIPTRKDVQGPVLVVEPV